MPGDLASRESWELRLRDGTALVSRCWRCRTWTLLEFDGPADSIRMVVLGTTCGQCGPADGAGPDWATIGADGSGAIGAGRAISAETVTEILRRVQPDRAPRSGVDTRILDACEILIGLADLLDDIRGWGAESPGRAVERVMHLPGAPHLVAVIGGVVALKTLAAPVSGLVRGIRVVGAGICATDGRLDRCPCARQLVRELSRDIPTELVRDRVAEQMRTEFWVWDRAVAAAGGAAETVRRLRDPAVRPAQWWMSDRSSDETWHPTPPGATSAS